MGIFDGIDFTNLPGSYNESSVREDIIAPLLKLLGYAETDENNKIKRNHSIKHPFIRIGVKKHTHIIPDYLLCVDQAHAFILDAKGPSENIRDGAHVQQAYSYAVNPDIQAKRFALCNGKALSVFDTDKASLLCYIDFASALEDDWGQVYELLSPAAFRNPHIFKYRQDYGLWCMNHGYSSADLQKFSNCYIVDIAILNQSFFTFSAVVNKEQGLLASFDGDISLLAGVFTQITNPTQKGLVMNYLKNAPFRYSPENAEESFSLSFLARLSDKVVRNENECYIPLRVVEFINRT